MKLRVFLLLPCLVGVAGCGALPNNCPNGEISREEALRKSVLDATARHIPGLKAENVADFLASQPRDCCKVQTAQRSLGEIVFEQPAARTRYRVILNLNLISEGKLIRMYADYLINPCGTTIRYFGGAQSRGR